MTKKIFLNSMLLLVFLFGFHDIKAVIEVNPNTEVQSVFDLSIDDISQLKNKDLAAKIGRKLSFKEKIALKFVKRNLKKNPNLLLENPYEKEPEKQQTIDGMAIAGFICGLVGIFFAGVILGTLGIVFGAISYNRIERSSYKRGRGLAIAGLVLGLIAAVGALIVISMM